MEELTIFELNAMYEMVSHKLEAVLLNEHHITWEHWVLKCANLSNETKISCFLQAGTRILHILMPQ